MTPIEIVALGEAGLELAMKIIALVQAAQKGDVAAAEILKSMLDHTSSLDAIKAGLRDFLDKQYETR